MRILNCDEFEFQQKIKGKKIICFGAGNTGRIICESFETINVEKQIVCFIDNDNKKWGTEIEISGRNIEICSPQILEQINSEQHILLITSFFWDEILIQIEKMACTKNIDCYIYFLFKMVKSNSSIDLMPYNEKQQISKVIHYCWFGGGRYPEIAVQCMDSWKKYCPDYEIVLWNEKNYDYTKSVFARKSFEEKKWNSLCDYARYDILYNHGGIYLDVDVELIQSLNLLLNHSCYMGFDAANVVNSGNGFGAIKGHKFMKENMDKMDTLATDKNMWFVDKNGNWNRDILAPNLTTSLLVKKGLRYNNQIQKLEDIIIYPHDYLSPALQIPTINTISIHRYASLWSFEGKNMQELWNKQREFYLNNIKGRILNGE